MAFEIPGFSPAILVAGADLSATPYRFIDIAAGKAALAGAGGRVVGVLQNKPRLNEAVTLMHNGVSFVEAGAAVAQGDNVQSDATGRAITLAAGIAQGVALEAASGAGIIISVLLVPRLA
jgi:hypothetical protein